MVHRERSRWKKSSKELAQADAAQGRYSHVRHGLPDRSLRACARRRRVHKAVMLAVAGLIATGVCPGFDGGKRRLRQRGRVKSARPT